MSLKYRDSQGVETHVAGLNGKSGSLVPSVSLYQKGQVNFSCDANQWCTVDITLNSPMPDNDYVVVMDSGNTAYVHVQNITYKTTTGFTAIVWNRDALSGTGIIKWQAFKLMTDEVTALDETKIEQNTANFANEFSATSSYSVGDFVTYNNVLYRCTVAHVQSAWNNSHFTATNVGDSIARYNDEILLPGYYDSGVLSAIKASADAVSDYTLFQGSTQSGAEGAWFGLKKTSTYWHCTVWDGHGVVSHLVYKNGTYTCNVIHEGVSNI